MSIWTHVGHRLQSSASTCLATAHAGPSIPRIFQRGASKKTRIPLSQRLKAEQSERAARALRNKGNIPTSVTKTLNEASGKPRQLKRKKPKFLPLKADDHTFNAYASLPSASLPLGNAETGWGEDKLKPPQLTSHETSTELSPPPALPPHMTNLLVYSRRIEGLLEPSTNTALQDVKPLSAQNPIATLAHGLDRVLFNPGVHWLQDPRSRVYNFPPYLENIPKVTDFAFERLSGFIKSSRDEDLWSLARRENRTFAGSTSSLSGMLSHIYFLLSGDKDVNTDNLSRHFGKEPRGFTAGQRMPVSVVYNHDKGVYAIDSDSDNDDVDKNILTWMGTLLEKYLTATPDEFAAYIRSNPAPESPLAESPLRDAYRYAKSDRFVMRSQLDCHDPRLPGTGVFDIKTRACLPIRMDLLNFEENSGYLIRSQTGKVESFEREYYDLIRSAFLKYSFQVRIGNMDGVIVAYHNTARMFGFQYISLQEMDEALFGSGPGIGDRVFSKCLGLLEQVSEEIVGCFPNQSVKCTFEKLEGQDVMNVWVQPVEWDGDPEEHPIRQLEVKVSNYLDQDPVRGSTAVSSIDQPWTTHWSIARLLSSGADIHRTLKAAKDRQFRFYDIPTGWDAQSVGQFWTNLSFNGQMPRENGGEYTPSNFRVAGKRIQYLRAVARSGREETERIASEEMGRKKVWLGGEVEEAWLQDAAEMAGTQSVGEGIEEVVEAEGG
ncbi:hypothetical protein D9615_002963 [Tricholomella constricta]|uniref:Pet127-domain-containing protein n=1 Tax=Tricholomella constricta TaxID=117010 RepID=A0A8H5HFU3_9AGAR|nr:hypothetical protein D9615_002963 [Tricholomella constricta]